MSSAAPAPGASDGRPPVPVPVPPGGHPLRVDPARRQGSPSAPATPPVGSLPSGHLPVVDETSAGGLVVERHVSGHRAAVILRRNRAGRLEMCLPKGHLEGRETPEEAAVREIHEETGIVGTVRSTLGVIDYWFSGEDRRVHKVVHHFLLRSEGGVITAAGDPDGEAEDACWVPLHELPDRLAYPNEQRLAATALQTLSDSPELVE
ncbi:NUDIX domain-containing protein [Isoptericola sp. CG 20/1183]|uniref:NUDIX domain-containing protein n=1 Tax=Isoptericola halotolerans TaxID=300560 RepID=A0ABX5EH45_9MICO|nr:MULTISPECIES: NUDIX hydrolase [Isoptericola]MCK0116012.1 NUDIX hydrolase [Isoptericola sp. S6320L]PRZ08809.1 NUDIX domain-containing protein [Isoptericola halotolerans]PRZ10744.1 NUDIX domain-containing protein [Isoptericola sp. CG 20/1183]